MHVTDPESKLNSDRSPDPVQKEDVRTAGDGRTVARQANHNGSAVDAISGVLAGKVPPDMDRNALRKERLSRYGSED